MSSNANDKLPTQQSVKAYTDSKVKPIDWTVPTGGYMRSGNTSQYTQTYQGDETWGNTVNFTALGVSTYMGYTDIYGGIWVAPADAKVTKLNMIVRNQTNTDDLTVKLYAVNPADRVATQLLDHDITISSTTSIVAVNESISSGNSIAEGYVLIATLAKQSSSGTGTTYFNMTVSGTFD
tara:strand:- start:30 stop:566 length:537 start_codon:yes stop_codon:yes gene_type:complete